MEEGVNKVAVGVQTTMCSAGVRSSREVRCEQLKCMLCGQQVKKRDSKSEDALNEVKVKK